MHLTLDHAELQALTGYRRPAEQLRELHRQGFFRARRAVTGEVVVERAHYEAVARGEAARRPQVRAPAVRSARVNDS